MGLSGHQWTTGFAKLEYGHSSQIDPWYQDRVHNEEIIEAGILNAVDRVVATPIDLSDQEFSNLMEFFKPITAPKALDRYNKIPKKVPSRLPLIDYTELTPDCSNGLSTVNHGNDC